ncbi:response regulator [Streptomyces monticola]|uniref:Response regulator n=1 Tax=Streptomyces monticola TaxID=2666263 RepID=A0ABW2JD46_9ACTN
MAEPPHKFLHRPIRVFILDDHDVVRRGLHDLLDAETDIEVVGEASGGAQALERGPALRPDVAILDVRLADTDGITVCRELRSLMPDLACLMLTSFDDDDALLDAIMAGAAGYVLKQIKGSDLISAVRTVAAGGSLLDPATAARLMNTLGGPGPPPAVLPGDGRTAPPGHNGFAVLAERDGAAKLPERNGLPSPSGSERERDGHAPLLESDVRALLSEREREILGLIGDGLTNRQIGKRTDLAERTVKHHVAQLLGKLGVERRVRSMITAAPDSPPGGTGTATGAGASTGTGD